MLASQTVEDIFARMLARYGSSWRAKWQGVDPAIVKADWADQLSGFSFDDITYGLSYLPAEFPPTAGQFRELCRNAPQTAEPTKLTYASTPIPPKVAEKLAEISSARHDPKAWAWALRDREFNHGGFLESGKRLTVTQRAMWRAAIHDVATIPDDDDKERTKRLQAETAKRVAEYVKQNGMSVP